VVESVTRWFGDTPDQPGSRLQGARFLRIATIAVVNGPEGRVVVANTHLDETSPALRRTSIVQLTGWLADCWPTLPCVVAGDLNATLDEPATSALCDAGYQSALSSQGGPASNGFGDPAHARQLDHIFTTPDLQIAAASIRREAGHASDHWPVLADLHPQR
jgi:endonuclease/exonuclease/phosphatase family metal-dependent hydrolase